MVIESLPEAHGVGSRLPGVVGATRAVSRHACVIMVGSGERFAGQEVAVVEAHSMAVFAGASVALIAATGQLLVLGLTFLALALVGDSLWARGVDTLRRLVPRVP